jgi:hypothetical protein
MRSLRFREADFIGGIEATFEGLPGNGKLTLWEALRLKVLFEDYIDARGRGDQLRPSRYFKSKRGDALKDAYKQTHDGGRLEDLRTKLKQLARNRCPSCGGARPAQLDHHLPKTVYREFSLLPANLVAACGECNQTKRATVGATPEEALLHPYFDEIPAVPFMRVTLNVEARHVSATLTFDDGAEIEDELLKARMRHHFNNVDVGAQLASEIAELIGETGEGLDQSDPNPAPEAVRAALLAAAAAKAKYFGQACWQAAVLTALADSEAYCAGGFRATRVMELVAE